MNDAKFGRVEGVPEGEPCFVLLAKDNATVGTLVDYRRRCERLGSPPEHLAAIERQIAAIQQWRREHRDLTKVPD